MDEMARIEPKMRQDIMQAEQRYEWKTKELEEEKSRTAQVAQELVESRSKNEALKQENEELSRKIIQLNQQDDNDLKDREMKMKIEKMTALQRENGILMQTVEGHKRKMADQEVKIDELERQLFNEKSKNDEMRQELHSLKNT